MKIFNISLSTKTIHSLVGDCFLLVCFSKSNVIVFNENRFSSQINLVFYGS